MGTGVIAIIDADPVRRLKTIDPVKAMIALHAVTHIALHDRRREPRRSHADEHGIQSARVRPGIDVRLLDVSAGGASIETAYQLLPGRRLILQLSFATCALTIQSSVLRCIVSHTSSARIAYRGGLAFERRLRWIVDATGVAGELVD
jgi:hypothetical protein